jgi:hypothetical protein
LAYSQFVNPERKKREKQEEKAKTSKATPSFNPVTTLISISALTTVW